MPSRSSSRSPEAEQKISDSGHIQQPKSGVIAVTGWGIHIPAFNPSELIDGYAEGPASPAERAHELLGRKGLLYKEQATLLACCAVHRALGLRPGEGGLRQACVPEPATAVVVSSNLGNIATVHKIVKTLQHGTMRDISAMDAPNASSNVIASAISIRFRFGGPSLMVCSGANSGLDAVALACLLLHTGRATRVVVVGTEPDDEVATRFHRERIEAKLGNSASLRAAAACIIVELTTAASPGTPTLGRVLHGASIAAHDNPPSAPVLIGRAHAASAGTRVIDLTMRLGDTYGALGVLQVAVAAAMLTTSSAEALPSVMVTCGDSVEGWSSLLVGRNTDRLV